MQIDELQTVAGGRAALVSQIVDPVFPRDLGRLGIAALDADRTVIGRAFGLPTPGTPKSATVTYPPIGSAAPQGVVAWPLATPPLRHRLSLVTLR